MGIYDRDYVRNEPQGIQWGGDWTAVATLIVLNVIVYVLDMFGNFQLQEWGALRADLFTQPWNVWQLLTSGFLHSGDSLMHLFYNMFSLWFFGTDLEGTLGKKRFIQFYLSMMVLAGLGWVIAQQPWFPQPGPKPLFDNVPAMIGASGAIMGVVLLSILYHPYRTIYFFGIVPLPAWLLGIFYVLGDLSGAAGIAKGNIAYAAHLSGGAAGALYWQTSWCLADIWPGGWRWPRSWRLSRTKVRLHRPHDDDEAEKRPMLDSDLTARVDELLEKINTHGAESLTSAEKRFLENASREYRQKQGK